MRLPPRVVPEVVENQPTTRGQDRASSYKRKMLSRGAPTCRPKSHRTASWFDRRHILRGAGQGPEPGVGVRASGGQRRPDTLHHAEAGSFVGPRRWRAYEFTKPFGGGLHRASAGCGSGAPVRIDEGPHAHDALAFTPRFVCLHVSILCTAKLAPHHLAVPQAAMCGRPLAVFAGLDLWHPRPHADAAKAVAAQYPSSPICALLENIRRRCGSIFRSERTARRSAATRGGGLSERQDGDSTSARRNPVRRSMRRVRMVRHSMPRACLSSSPVSPF